VATPLRVVRVGAEQRARPAAQLRQLALGRELGRRLLAVVVVEADPAQLPARVPGARQADGAAVAVGGFAHEDGRAAWPSRIGRGKRELAGAAVAIAALVDVVLALQDAVLEVAHDAHEDALVQLLLAHHRPALAVAAAHQARLALRRAAVGGVDVRTVQFAHLQRRRRAGGLNGGKHECGTRDNPAMHRRIVPRRFWIYIVGAVVLTLIAVLLAVNLLGGETRIERRLERHYSVDHPQFVRDLGFLLGPQVIGGNRYRALLNGDEIFPAMLAAIRSARSRSPSRPTSTGPATSASPSPRRWPSGLAPASGRTCSSTGSAAARWTRHWSSA
jgi:hypothetical protein